MRRLLPMCESPVNGLLNQRTKPLLDSRVIFWLATKPQREAIGRRPAVDNLPKPKRQNLPRRSRHTTRLANHHPPPTLYQPTLLTMPAKHRLYISLITDEAHFTVIADSIRNPYTIYSAHRYNNVRRI